VVYTVQYSIKVFSLFVQTWHRALNFHSRMGIAGAIFTFAAMLASLVALSSYLKRPPEPRMEDYKPEMNGNANRLLVDEEIAHEKTSCTCSCACIKRKRRSFCAQPLTDGALSLNSTAVFVWLAFLGRRFPKEPSANSVRLAFAAISLGGFAVISLYR